MLQVALRVDGVCLLGEEGRVWSGDLAPVFFLAVELWVLLLMLEVSVTDHRVPYWLGAPSLAARGLGLFSVCFPDVPGPDCFLFLLA